MPIRLCRANGDRSLLSAAGASVAFAASLFTGGPAVAQGQAGYCNEYANQAVISATQNRNFGCGGWGSRYGFDYRRHFNWCMSVPVPVAHRERLIRQRFIRACLGRR